MPVYNNDKSTNKNRAVPSDETLASPVAPPYLLWVIALCVPLVFVSILSQTLLRWIRKKVRYVRTDKVLESVPKPRALFT